jgi:hypothetical protein
MGEKSKAQMTLNSSFERFRNIYDLGRGSFYSHLPEWLDFYSKQLLIRHRAAEYEKKRFDTYSRGQIIFVNYGYNIGYELSIPHYSIVMTKNDSATSGSLNVLPLTSKKHPDSLFIGSPFEELMIPYLSESIDHLESELPKIETLDYENDKISLIVGDIRKIVNEPPSEERSNKLNELSKNLDIYEKKYMIYENNMRKYDYTRSLLKRYSTIAKNTYAAINKLAYISKDRIFPPLNKEDPCLKVLIPSKTMIQIDNEIIKYYTYFRENNNKNY